MSNLVENASEYELFQKLLSDHFAILADVTARYTKRLAEHTREEFMKLLLETAWRSRGKVAPQKHALLRWWKDCCETTAKSRREWTIWYSHGPVVVTGRSLGHQPV
jgi:hypothetical protein